ncbi:hypothetical protein ACJMK2_034591, partial [Sinanodonta woodiana]
QFVTDVKECNSGCGFSSVANCTCSEQPLITFKDDNKAACSIKPVHFNQSGSNAYDLILNNTIDLDQDCM